MTCVSCTGLHKVAAFLVWINWKMSAGSRLLFRVGCFIDACIFGNVFLLIRISINNSDLSSRIHLHLIVRNHFLSFSAERLQIHSF